MQNSLSQELKNLQTTLNNIGAYVFTKDTKGKYTYVNELVRELFDYPLDEIIGFDDSKFFELEVSDDIKINDEKVLSEGKVLEVEEKNVMVKTGEIKYYQTVKKPLYDDNNKIIGMFGVSTDITARKEMEFELKRKQDLLDTVLNNVDAYIYMKDQDYKYIYLNPKTASLFKMDPEDVVGKREEDFLSKEDAEHFRQLDAKVFKTGDVQSGEEEFIASDGVLHNYWSTKVPIKDKDGKIRSYIGISTDITQLSTTDALTGIHNRRTLDIEIKKIFSHYKRNKHNYCIIMADIDHFKQINDRYGHFEGDTALQILSKTIQKNIRSTDVFGRWGGEEFLLVCPDTKIENASHLAEKLRYEIEKLSSKLDYQLTISLGVSKSTEDDTDAYRVVKRADKNMYRA
ncbi:MAG: diguanylate cyclase, partial [Campylobacterota bacterium]|nr:diguanylate cyclase [Campylobacterota bacterium]